MNLTAPSEEDYLIRLVLEGEHYITPEFSAIVQRELERRLAAGVAATYGGLAAHAHYVVEADVRYAEYMISLLRVPPGVRKPIGYFILEQRLVKPTQLLEGLEEQAQIGGRLGEILVRNGWMQPAQIEAILDLQRAST